MSAPDLARMIFENDRLRELVDRLDHEKKAMEAERDAAFAMSKCECGTDEACKNLVTLRDAIKQLEKESDTFFKETIALNERVGELEAAQRWIPVGERLPERNVLVLVFSIIKFWERPFQFIGFHNGDDWMKNLGDIAINGEVLFWMLLPKAPEVE